MNKGFDKGDYEAKESRTLSCQTTHSQPTEHVLITAAAPRRVNRYLYFGTLYSVRVEVLVRIFLFHLPPPLTSISLTYRISVDSDKAKMFCVLRQSVGQKRQNNFSPGGRFCDACLVQSVLSRGGLDQGRSQSPVLSKANKNQEVNILMIRYGGTAAPVRLLYDTGSM